MEAPPAPYKTWLHFKIDFTISHQEYRESQVTKPAAAGFNTSPPDNPDAHLETIDAIANLATATAADWTAVANLTTTNAALTTELVTVNSKLVKALEKSPLSTCGQNLEVEAPLRALVHDLLPQNESITATRTDSDAPIARGIVRTLARILKGGQRLEIPWTAVRKISRNEV